MASRSTPLPAWSDQRHMLDLRSTRPARRTRSKKTTTRNYELTIANIGASSPWSPKTSHSYREDKRYKTWCGNRARQVQAIISTSLGIAQTVTREYQERQVCWTSPIWLVCPPRACGTKWPRRACAVRSAYKNYALDISQCLVDPRVHTQ